MGNIWGTQLSPYLPTKFSPSADTSCNSSTETTVITSGAIFAPSPGSYAPHIAGVLTILLGAAAPSAMVLAFKIGAGSDVDTYTVEPALLANLAELVIPLFLIGAASASAWVGSGSTLNVTVNATGQAVTCLKVGSRVTVQLLRVGS